MENVWDETEPDRWHSKRPESRGANPGNVFNKNPHAVILPVLPPFPFAEILDFAFTEIGIRKGNTQKTDVQHSRVHGSTDDSRACVKTWDAVIDVVGSERERLRQETAFLSVAQ